MLPKTTLKYNFPQKVNKHTHTHYIGNAVWKWVILHSIGRNANRTIGHCKIP